MKKIEPDPFYNANEIETLEELRKTLDSLAKSANDMNAVLEDVSVQVISTIPYLDCLCKRGIGIGTIKRETMEKMKKEAKLREQTKKEEIKKDKESKELGYEEILLKMRKKHESMRLSRKTESNK